MQSALSATPIPGFVHTHHESSITYHDAVKESKTGLWSQVPRR